MATSPDAAGVPGQESAPGVAVLVPVLDNHRFDEGRLTRYLADCIPGFRGPCRIRQFQGGFSNPTFHLETADRAFVLRKKPPGLLLASAHAVDREYRVLAALAGSGVPVPAVHLFCEDDGIVGSPFYVMEYVDGRVYTDRRLPGVAPADRGAMYDAMNGVLARLHQVDYRAVGLADFGKPVAYVARQVARWSKQYLASRVEETPAMDRLMEWLPANTPPNDEATLAHGDYRLGNLLFHPTEPRVIAVLDWELSTIGHPIGDLAYCCLTYHQTSDAGAGLSAAEAEGLGIPSEAQFVEAYRQRVGRASIPNWTFFLVFSLFRSASILAGVYKRSLDGNSVDARQARAREAYRDIAASAWSLARR